MNKYQLKIIFTTYEKEVKVMWEIPITADNKEQARDYICDNSVQSIIDELCKKVDLEAYKKKFSFELYLCNDKFEPKHLIYTIEDNIKNHLKSTR